MIFCNLTQIPQNQIYNTFLKVFCDYKVSVQISYNQFLSLQKRSRYSPEFSYGCLDEDNSLVGLAINGVGNINSKPTCYGCALGFIPEYRNKNKLAFNFVDFYLSTIQRLGFKIYLGEVMRDNTPTLKMMQKFGFVINKKYLNYRKLIDEMDTKNDDFDDFCFETVNQFPVGPFYKPLEYKASWQNSLSSIHAILTDFIIITVKKDGNIIGYGAINKKQGDIPQFVLHKDFRGKGLDSKLLSKLMNHTASQYVGFLNVDENNPWLNSFLVEEEFEIYSKEFELIKYF